MAYMSQETKALIAPKVKAICKKYNVKASLAVRNHSTLVLNIKHGSIDFLASYNKKMESLAKWHSHAFTPETKHIQVNEYHYDSHFDGVALKFLNEIIPVMNAGNHNNSDIQTDYFDVGFYTDINIGAWNKPYAIVK